MFTKRPEETLASFVATLPNYLRVTLEGGGEMTPQDWAEYAVRDPQEDEVLIKKYEELLQSCPEQRQAYIERQQQELDSMVLHPRRGRPRKDFEAEQARQLKSQDKTWGQIGEAQGKSTDAARKLAKSRDKKTGE